MTESNEADMSKRGSLKLPENLESQPKSQRDMIQPSRSLQVSRPLGDRSDREVLSNHQQTSQPPLLPATNEQAQRRASGGLELEMRQSEQLQPQQESQQLNNNQHMQKAAEQNSSQSSQKKLPPPQNPQGNLANALNQMRGKLGRGVAQKPESKPKGRKGADPTQDKLRNIYVDVPRLPEYVPDNQQFCQNGISTTKYTFWSFLPKALFVQFKRMSNVYFLATAILTTIPGFSPISPASTFAPLSFVIIMSMMREAYEDYKRMRNDKLTNNRRCYILTDPKSIEHKLIDKQLKKDDQLEEKQRVVWNPQGYTSKEDLQELKSCFTEKLWKDVKCGDILLIEEEDHLPADCVFIMSSAVNGECFVQTATLDGERALKHKQCQVPIKKAIETHGLNNFICTYNCEAPSKNLYDFSGFLESEQLPDKGTIQLRSESKVRTITVDNKQLGLRGSNLANTAWAIGVAVYTGRDTKLMLNQGQSRFKQSRIEQVVNKMCVYLIIAQAILCTIMSVFSGYFVSNYAELSQDGLRRKAEYIFYTELSRFGRSMNGTATDNQGVNYSPAAEGFMTYGVYFILLNTIIPLSLVVSIEFIKLTQTPFMANDVQMFDPVSMKPCQPMSMTLHEEMASISYIFADKTGTLTANVMQFKACSIGSVCYDEDYRDEDYEYMMDDDDVQSVTPGKAQSPARDQFPGIKEEDIALQDTPGSQMSPEDYLVFKARNQGKFNESGKEAKMQPRRGSITKIVWNYPEASEIIKNLLFRKRYFINEETNLGQSHPGSPPLILSKQNEYLHQFWLTVALCHDVITTVSVKQVGDKEEKVLNYQGTSPDEITLLDAAKEVGYSFLDRTSDSMQISIFEQKKTYRLLQKFEFTSERKKMTVIVQDESSGQIILYSKGADLAIFDRLSQQIEQHFLEATKEDLIKFSTKGFRTLCFGIRVLDQAYFKEWQYRYDTAKLESIKLGAVKAAAAKLPGLSSPQIAAIDPNAMLLTLEHELESELFLLGATALEDKLQDGVPEAIEDFRNAGIKVWMLTGDKLETAENIGFSSKMFNEKMFIFKLQTPDKTSTRLRLQQIDMKIFEIEKQHATPVIGTQFILNPNAAMETYEARNIIQALEEFKHESRASEHTMNDSWARKPTLKRKMRKRLEEIVPDKNAIAERLIRESQVFSRQQDDQLQYVPRSFDIKGGQYIFKGVNVYRSAASQKMKIAKKNSGLHVGGINLNLMQTMNLDSNPTSGIIDNEDKFGILIEGHTLAYIQNSKSMKEKFLRILAKCEAVVVCRASPSQKGQVVEMIKESEPDAVTLAIGDGANDVNMIQKSHVGIGIFGKEGYQAAGSSDYAIGQFRFLRRLLFTHGRWNGIRLTAFMLLFFNKNLFFTMPQFWFGWNNGFSGQTYYDEVYMSAFNLFATNFAICGFAVWEQDLPTNHPEQSELIELFMPQIYLYSKDNELFTTKKFFGWSAVSLLQSLFMYGIPQYAYDNFIFANGKKQDFWAQSICSYFSLVVLHYAISFFFTRNYTWWASLIYLLSLLTFAPFQIVTYDRLDGYALSGRLQEIAYDSIEFYLVMLVSVALCLIPFLFYFQANSLLFPSLKDLLVQSQVNKKQVIEEADPQKAKDAMDMLKKKQYETLQKWEQDYNTFQKPAHLSNEYYTEVHNDAADGNPKPALITLVNNQTPQKQSSSRKAPAGPGQSLLQKNGLTHLERIVEEESKHPFEEEIMPFQMVDAPCDEEEGKDQKIVAIAKNKADASPLRMSASRKGLNFHRHQGSSTKDPTPCFGFGGEEGMKRVSQFQTNEILPKALSPNDEDTPLRITRSGASPSPLVEDPLNPQLHDGVIGIQVRNEDFCMTENDSINDASQLDNKMQIIKNNTILDTDEEGGHSMMTKLNNKVQVDRCK